MTDETEEERRNREAGWAWESNGGPPVTIASTATVDEARLRATTDASVWAEEFAKVRPDVDRGLMIGWFANAIETGRDHGRPHRCSATDPCEVIDPLHVALWGECWVVDGPDRDRPSPLVKVVSG